MTALHVANGQRRSRSWQGHIGAALAPATSAETIIREIVRLGDHYGVEVKGAARTLQTPQEAILRQLGIGGHNLLVMGVSPRPGDQLFFGEVPAELLERAECSVLFVASEPPASRPEPPNASAAQEHPTVLVAPANPSGHNALSRCPASHEGPLVNCLDNEEAIGVEVGTLILQARRLQTSHPVEAGTRTGLSIFPPHLDLSNAVTIQGQTPPVSFRLVPRRSCRPFSPQVCRAALAIRQRFRAPCDARFPR